MNKDKMYSISRCDIYSAVYVKINNFMSNNNFPQPPSHKTFVLGKTIIDSNFDSGNCSFAERVNSNTYAIWIASDHPKNIYRMWFYFSAEGIAKGTLVNFQVKNMQNQSKLLYEGLVPVVREASSKEWKRVSHKVNLTSIVYGDNEIQWTFTHQFSSNQKHYFAIYFPWSNQDNSAFLQDIAQRTQINKDVYFHRGTIIHTLQGRPVEMLTITSMKGVTEREQSFDDALLFANAEKPKQFQGEKKVIVIGARVHPGEVPGSHVMTGIIDQLTRDTKLGQLLRDAFIFYIFPIFNPDGVARGHFRVDTNGINLNRCYINPSPRQQGAIYAVKKVVLHSHSENRYFAFLDLHAQASRKGNFIYGNSINQLRKQIDACLFAKLLSLNSEHFEYQGSNFMEKHMYCRDKADHMSKEGCGRVAMYHATKNPNSWTLECSYHMSQRVNILEPTREEEDQIARTDQDNLDQNLIKNYKVFPSKQADEAYSIQTYHDLGREVLESLLDLVGLNPTSRIANPNNYFKTIDNVKLSLAIALLRMAPNRFQPQFRKVFFMLETANDKIAQRCFRALYLMIIRKATLPKLADYVREEDNTIVYPSESLKRSNRNFKRGVSRHNHKPNFNHNQARLKAKLQGENCLEMQSTNSIIITTQDSPEKSESPQSCFSQLLTNKKTNKQSKNSVIKIVQIDKQIMIKQSAKQEIRLFSLGQAHRSQTRYEMQGGQVTTFSDYRKKDRTKGENLMRKTYNEVFKLQILPKLINNQKLGMQLGINSSVLLKHHKSLK